MMHLQGQGLSEMSGPGIGPWVKGAGSGWLAGWSSRLGISVIIN